MSLLFIFLLLLLSHTHSISKQIFSDMKSANGPGLLTPTLLFLVSNSVHSDRGGCSVILHTPGF